MDRKDKEVSYDFGDDYKTLPLEMRVRVNMTANNLLEIQKGNNAFRNDGGERFSGDDRENRGKSKKPQNG